MDSQPSAESDESDESAEEVRSLLRRAAAIDDPEDDERWAIIRAVHGRADRAVFDAVRELARSARVPERVVALDVLGQIGYRAGRPFLEETLPALIDATGDEHPKVVAAAVAALGMLGDARALPAILRQAGHSSAGVRVEVAAAVPGAAVAAGDPPGPAAVDALIALSADPDGETRDWATFGLGSQFEDEDSEAIRDALAARLDDREGDTAGEALLGLARRRDPRALPALLARLDDDPGNLVVEAAAALGASEARPALLRLKRDGWQRGDPRPSVLDDALRACGEGGGMSAG